MPNGRSGSLFLDKAEFAGWLSGFGANEVIGVCLPSPKTGRLREVPRFHHLRKTGATRVEAVSFRSIEKAFLGHADEDVTDSQLQPSLDAVRDAVNRAARSINGEHPAGAIPFPTRVETVTKSVSAASERVEIGERRVSNPHA